MTHEERVQAIIDFDFTERQARFVVLVVRHGGVCVPRQYASFAGIANGGSIEAIGYDVDSQELDVQFVSGETYRYAGVPSNIFEAFMSAPSKGSYFNREIKPAFQQFTKL